MSDINRTTTGTTTGTTTTAPTSATSHTSTNSNTGDSHSVPGLVKQLANDVTSLFTKELALAKAEVAESVNEAKKGAVSMVSGGSILYAGFLILLLSAVYGLSNVVEPWLAALIVGGIVAILGAIMVKSGQKKMEPSSFKPERTMDSVQKDRDAVRGATS